MQGKTENPKYYIRLERLPSRRTVCLSWLNWASNWASFFLDGRTEPVWGKIQFWSLYIGWRGEITRTCVRRGECNSFLISALFSDTQHLVIRATLSQRHLPIAGGQGQAWKGANAWGCTSLLPQHSLQVERASTGEGPSEGKCFLMCPCVSRRRSMTTWQPWSSELPWRFEWRSEVPGCGPSCTLPAGWPPGEGRSRHGAGGITRSPSLRAPAMLAPFSVCLQKVKWITGGRKKERRERRKQLPMSESKTKKIKLE